MMNERLSYVLTEPYRPFIGIAAEEEEEDIWQNMFREHDHRTRNLINENHIDRMKIKYI